MSLDNDIYKTIVLYTYILLSCIYAYMQDNNINSLFFIQIFIYEILNEVRNSKSKSSKDFTDLSLCLPLRK